MNKLSLVVPAYNEAECIERFVETVSALPLANPLEIVFVDDGSTDATLELVKAAARSRDFVRYVSFSRNFGKEAALLAGLAHSTGDLVVTMDADLQHDPALLADMIAAIESGGYDCAAACRVTRTGEPSLRSWLAGRFYSFMSRCSDVTLKDGSMDYRMMTRQVVEAVLSLGESGRFTKGIYQWVGFRTKWLETANVGRTAGATKWNLRSLFLYSLRGMIAFSTMPLQLASALGLVLVALSVCGALGLCAARLLCAVSVGWGPALCCVALLLGGIQLSAVGILGLYLGEILRETKRRPVYIVKESK